MFYNHIGRMGREGCVCTCTCWGGVRGKSWLSILQSQDAYNRKKKNQDVANTTMCYLKEWEQIPEETAKIFESH